MPSPALWALHATLPVLQPPTRWAPGLRGGVGGQSHGCCRASAPPRSELEPVPLGFATWRPCWPPSLLASVEVPSRAHTPTRAFPGPVSPPANACGSVPRRWSCLSPPGPPSSWCCGRRPRFPLPEGQGGLAGGWGGPCSARSMAPGLCPGPWQGVAVPSRAVRDSASLDRQGRPVPPSGRWTVVWCGLSPCGPSRTCLSGWGRGGRCLWSGRPLPGEATQALDPEALPLRWEWEAFLASGLWPLPCHSSASQGHLRSCPPLASPQMASPGCCSLAQEGAEWPGEQVP